VDEAATISEVNLANALDLSESEEEEELEDLIEDFALTADEGQVRTLHHLIYCSSVLILQCSEHRLSARTAVLLPVPLTIPHTSSKIISVSYHTDGRRRAIQGRKRNKLTPKSSFRYRRETFIGCNNYTRKC
jgi:hypothetical protein